MEHILPYLFFTIIGYLSGSIVYSYFLPKLFFKKDILKSATTAIPAVLTCLNTSACRWASFALRSTFSKDTFPSLSPPICSARKACCLPSLLPRRRQGTRSAHFCGSGRQGNQRFVWKLSGPYAAVFYGLVAGNTVCYSVYRIPAQPAQPARGGKLHGNACNEPAV